MNPFAECLYLPIVNAGEYTCFYEFLLYDDSTDTLHRVTGFDKEALRLYYVQSMNWADDPLGHEQACLPCYGLQGKMRANMPQIYADKYPACSPELEIFDKVTRTGYNPFRLILDQLKTIYTNRIRHANRIP